MSEVPLYRTGRPLASGREQHKCSFLKCTENGSNRGQNRALTGLFVPSSLASGEVPRGDKMLFSGTDPESYITDYTSVYEDKARRLMHAS